LRNLLASRLLLALALGSVVLPLGGTVGCQGRREGAKTATTFACPMHPDVTAPKRGDCTICGMKLVPIEKPPADGQASRATSPSGLAPVHLSEDTRKQMGLTLGTVEKRPVRREVRTPARVVVDQSRVVRLNAPVDGWVEKLWVNGVGERVRKGDPIIQIYGTTVINFLRDVALVFRQGSPEIARERLKHWGISQAQIDAAMIGAGVSQPVLTLMAPSDGFVAEKTVYTGQKLTTGEPLVVIADLSHVWAEVDLFESDIPWLKPGMHASITFPYWPGKDFKGRITVLNPFLDPQTRTLRARLEVPNPSLELKPEMFGTALIAVDLGDRLVVPEGAVMRTGDRAYAFRAAEGDRIEPVEVTLGVRAEGVWEVLKGLKAGDRVVSSANFLVDSESSLKAALEAVAGR
jgi:Cu(I)/Ag(I) efflux system membrane fusion protein